MVLSLSDRYIYTHSHISLELSLIYDLGDNGDRLTEAIYIYIYMYMKEYWRKFDRSQGVYFLLFSIGIQLCT